MISLYAESHICTITLIFYTCIWIPLVHITQFIRRIVAFLFNPHGQLENGEIHSVRELDLPVWRFRDLEISNKNNRDAIMINNEEEKETCSICLMEFENEDLVNKLRNCGHVFHMECMEKWLHRCQFTCPLCRSLVLSHVSSSPCKSAIPSPARD
ncbi:hypothetical protein BUALT_Bualt03G0079400 [Buddleja alternifolia]|uniref:RING-type domain-containing protein n=1 Tax=Buddleja alternifolia TaxID=168488 RepID=A0AAV6XRY6_9LAMI|nr:hypothetical protein BUALT_Bualt03G0079400 [Buddleja alternifolia]